MPSCAAGEQVDLDGAWITFGRGLVYDSMMHGAPIRRSLLGALGALALDGPAGCSDPVEPPAPTSVVTDFTQAGGFFSAPFPSDHRLRPDGTVDLTRYPNPDDIPFVAKMLDLLADADGFGTSSGIFFTLDGALDEASLPELADTVTDAAPVFLIGIDPQSSDYLRRYPVSVHYEADGGPFGAARLLSLLPLQGVPLRARTRYAAVITTRLRDSAGEPLAQAPAIGELLQGRTPAGLSGVALASYQAAVSALAADGVAPEQVAGLAAFTTWDPTEGMQILLDQARGLPLPQPLSPLSAGEVFDSYCVYQSTLEMPVYQAGTPPYSETGGGIVFGPAGPELDRYEEARIVVTVPRQPMPAGGWPTALMVRTGGGGDRPLVDRGVRDDNGQVLVAGSGPALHFAAAGFAGVSVDGPHGGIRNITGGDEQLLIFNFTNPLAMRDNIRQSALELALMADIIDSLSVDVSACPGTVAPADTARFDIGRLAIMGHSMGATIAPLTLAVEPRFGAAVLSGAGGSWIENVVYKESPVAVRPLAEVLLHYPTHERHLHEHDPVLTLLQWGGEPADPPLYAGSIINEPGPHPARQLLMLQGIVDTYILPPIANATSLSLGLDLGGPPLDESNAALQSYQPLRALLPYVGRQLLELPITGNRNGVTAVVVQHPQGPIEDGHEIAFQTEPPKHQYRCFLESWLSGTPTVPRGAAVDAPCQ